MNISLIIIAVSAILVLMLILKFLVRDNINSGDDAVYGPTGTDDLPADNLFDFSKAKNLMSSAKNQVYMSNEERFATKLITEIKKLLKENGEKKIYGDLTGTFILSNWRTMINKDKLIRIYNEYSKPNAIIHYISIYIHVKEAYKKKTLNKNKPYEGFILQLMQTLDEFLPELEQIIFETNDMKKFVAKYGRLSLKKIVSLVNEPEVQRSIKLLNSVYNVLIKEYENDKIETFENINEMYPGYSEDSYAQF